MTKDHSSFVKIIGRYLNRHAVSGEGLDPILFHSPGRVDDNHVASIKLNAIAGIRQYLCYEAFKLQKLFLRHLAILSLPEPDVRYACSRLGAERRRKAT